MLYNYTADLCGFFLSILIGMVCFFNKTEQDNKTRYLSRLITINFLLCGTSTITAILNNHNSFGVLALFANYIYCYVCIHILIYVVLYIFSLIPGYFDKMQEYEKTTKITFITSEFVLLALVIVLYALKFEIPQIISYCKYWSYFNIGGTILSCSILLYILGSTKSHLQIRKSTLIIFPFLVCGGIFQFTHTNIKISGFLYALLVSFFYIFYHSKQLDIMSGGYLNSSFSEDFSKLLKKKKEFYVVTVVIANFDFLKKILKEEEINKQLSNALRVFNYANTKLKIYRESVDRVSFIIEKEHTTNIEEGINKMINLFLKQNDNFKDVSEILHFKTYFADCPDTIDNFRSFIKVRKAVYEQCEIDSVYRIKKEDISKILNEDELIGIFNDIFTKNDATDERIQVVYQPILDIETNQFKTMEALTRLKINGKLIFPDNFIHILEDNGLMHKYSLIVLQKICIFLNKIKDKDFDIDGVSLNISSDEFRMNSFESDIVNILQKYNIDPSYIRLELTESNDAATQAIIDERMTSMQAKGFKFYLDDFGTGYSNITKLATLKFDTIKIDKSIIWNSLSNEDIKQLLQDLTTFIRARNMDVLFEGVETQEMVELSDKVKYLQGYLYSKPITEEETIKFLENNN